MPNNTIKRTPQQKSENFVSKGLTREQAIQKVNEFFDAQQGAPTVDASWDVKVEVYQGVKIQLRELKLVSVVLQSNQGLNQLNSPVA